MDDYISLYEKLATGSQEPWSMHLEDQQVTIIILLTSYLEALINFYLSFKMDAAEFEKVERWSPVKKWNQGPQLKVGEYRLPNPPETCKCLEALFDRRNRIVHMRPELSRGDVVVHAGNSYSTSPGDHHLLIKWMKLPVVLVENIKKFDPTSDGIGFYMGSDAYYFNVDWERLIADRKDLRGRMAVRR